MNNLTSYCGLTDPRMSASDTDLPVQLKTSKRNVRKRIELSKLNRKFNWILIVEQQVGQLAGSKGGD